VETLKGRLREFRKLKYLLQRQKKGLESNASRRREYIILAHNIRVTEAEMEFVKDLIKAFSQGELAEANVFTQVNDTHDRW
jgi:predicted Fe-Mo cluster-binding NifX family protein